MHSQKIENVTKHPLTKKLQFAQISLVDQS